MNNIKFILLVWSVFCTLSLCAANNPSPKHANRQTVVFSCDIHCQGCCDKIMKNIAFERGVKDLVCDLKSKTVTVTYDAKKTDIPALQTAFAKIGKPATPLTVGNQPSPASAGAPSPTDADSGASLPYN